MRRMWAFAGVLGALFFSLSAAADDARPVVRASYAGTLTNQDRASMRAIGISDVDSGVVVIRKIGAVDEARIERRLRALAKSLEGFAPSGACDAITSEGEGAGLCTGSADGPLGRVPVRMPVAASFTKTPDGKLRFVITNRRPMEAKALFAWTSIVDPQKLKVVYELHPQEDGWLVYTRVAVDMNSHEGSAKTISDAMLKLESWLTRDLARGEATASAR